MNTIATDQRPYGWGGVRAVRTELIEAVESYPVGGPCGWRVIRTAFGPE